MINKDNKKKVLATTPECLTPEQLDQVLQTTSSTPHLDQCARCQAELAMLKAFTSDAPLPGEGAGVAWISSQLDRRIGEIKSGAKGQSEATLAQGATPSWIVRIFKQKGFSWALPAAAIAAIAIASAFLLRPEKAPKLQAGLETQRLVYRTQELQLVSPIGEVQRVPAGLSWQAAEGSSNYHVVIMEVDRSELWSGDTHATSIEIPTAVRAKFLPGKPLLWQITARDAQGNLLSTSQVQRFVIAGAATSTRTPKH
jgi:hypothetical protein